jgi:hypothetical protein
MTAAIRKAAEALLAATGRVDDAALHALMPEAAALRAALDGGRKLTFKSGHG